MNYRTAFDEIGNEIEKRWRRCEYDSSSFPAIAEEAASWVPEIAPQEFIDQMHGHFDLSYRFSDYDIHAFTGRGFRIEVLHWLTNSTDIHEHAFCGAFRIMRGSSLQVEYGFEETHRIAENFGFGNLKIKTSTVLEAGQVAIIFPGNVFIHGNFHLDRPTCTMVIRTVRNSSTMPQSSYLFPHIRIESNDRQDHQKRFSAMLEYTATLGPPDVFENMIVQFIRDSTLQECIALLMHRRVLLGDDERLKRLLGHVGNLHPAFAVQIATTIIEQRRRVGTTLIRRRTEDDKQRFLLALLINIADAEFIRQHVEKRFPECSAGTTCAKILQTLGASKQMPTIADRDISTLAKIIDGQLEKSAATVSLQAVLTAPMLQPLFDKIPSYVS